MLIAYRDGLKTEAAITTVLGVEPEDFDEGFATFVAAEHGHALDKLEEWHHTQVEIANKLAAEEWQDVIELAQGLIDIIPQYIEPDSPYLALARAHNALDDRSAALQALTEFWRNGGYEPAALKRLADWLVEARRNDDAIEVFTSINLVDPLDGNLHGELGDILLAAGRAEEALREYEIAISLQPHDMATAWYRLAQAQYQLGDIERSQAHLLQALDVAPNFRPAQRLLLKLASGPDDDQ
jgi:tetratricopeptide (TPR) repeat protein